MSDLAVGVETLYAEFDGCQCSILFKTSKACAADGHVQVLRRAKDWVVDLFV